MKIFGRKCKHNYKEIDRQFTQINPNKLAAVGIMLSDEDRNKIVYFAVYGMTTILLRCEKCGDVKDRLVVGNFSDERR